MHDDTAPTAEEVDQMSRMAEHTWAMIAEGRALVAALAGEAPPEILEHLAEILAAVIEMETNAIETEAWVEAAITEGLEDLTTD